ncbi:brca1 c terminus domain-containing protein [Cyclospora cayetanensis]|uniref:Pescadillo homolog n=1 Tax=Cyclospora cayetanensis TaxID=88456 RepID=A0A1D3CUP9_9EIME|nr:brca1 c terminus domain-containing protein [Cyclospora cayetanensis]
MGKKLKKHQKGEVAQYTTRARALRKLQVSLADFRRLCILKGIYPRDPKKKRFGVNQVYYHKKDLLHLQADGVLLSALRDISATNKKIRKSVGRKEHKDAKRRLRLRPKLPLQHLIKQKFPSLLSAIEDIDDCLCTVFLIASLPSAASRGLPPERSLLSVQLCDEFLLLLSHLRALRKAFVSIKGFFFQAELLGRQVTWVLPHAFAQALPPEIDCRVLDTFSLMYCSSLRHILYKLYKMEGLRYPPAPPKGAPTAAAGSAHLSCHSLQQAVSRFHMLKVTKAPQQQHDSASAAAGEEHATNPLEDATTAGDSSNAEQDTETEEEGEETDSAAEERDDTGEEESEDEELEESKIELAETGQRDNAAPPAKTSKPKASAGVVRHDTKAAPESNSEGEESELERPDRESDTDSEEEGESSEEEDSEDADTAAGAEQKTTSSPLKGCGVSEHPVQCLFEGLVFFVCRETPLLPLSFAIRSCGGRVGWQSEGSPIVVSDKSITHQVVDRPAEAVFQGFGGSSPSREFVQPQWIFDCLNAGILLPTADYAPGKALPPHLSPFVDDEAEGYIPRQREVLAKLQKAHKEKTANAETQEGLSDSDGPVDDPEASWRRERGADVEAEVKGSSVTMSTNTSDCTSPPPRKSRKEELSEEQLKHQKALMNKKHKRLLERIEFGHKRKEKEAAALKAKRRALEGTSE